VVAAIGANEVREDLGVSRIGLRPGDRVAVPVPGGGHRVDGEDVVAGLHERSHEEPSIGLDPDDDLGRVLRMLGDHRVQPAHPGDVVAHLPLAEHRALLVHDADVVTAL
jgi:hypothetical protein